MYLYEIPPFQLQRSAPRPIFYLSDQQLIEEAQIPNATMLFDIECYPNYFLIVFMSYVTGRVLTLELSPETEIDKRRLKWIVDSFRLAGFNSRNYDIPLLWAAMGDLWLAELNLVSYTIVTQGFRAKECENEFGFKIGFSNHIDLFDVAVGKQTSLKTYAARLHVPKLQDLPFNPHEPLTQRQAIEVKLYCINDLDCTAFLFTELEEQIKLREQIGLEYEIDLRSKSDAQIAEAVICRELTAQMGSYPGKGKAKSVYRYEAPGYIKFSRENLKEILQIISSTDFIFHKETCKYLLPFDLKVTIGKGKYQLGIGGLHSCEQSISHFADDNTLLLDFDVSSYYPAIILNQKLAPSHLGEMFLEVYQSIVKRRLIAKTSGDKVTNECLKVVINGSFGKFGSIYSRLFAPELLLQVTLTGQLGLLLLIEWLESSCISVLSANTDGLVISCHKDHLKLLKEITDYWQKITCFSLESTSYCSIHFRDVNNYIAIKNDGNVKTKGLFAKIGGSPPSILGKNPTGWICVQAVIDFLTKQIPIEKTIRTCKDIRDFLYVRKVKGGARKGKYYLGKTIRWYYRKNEFGTINYLSSNVVPRTQGAYPLFDLPKSVPNDIDYDWYIKESQSHLREIGLSGFRQIQKHLWNDG